MPGGGPKSLPVHHPWCTLYLTFGPLRSVRVFWEIKKIIIGLDSFSHQRLIYWPHLEYYVGPIWIILVFVWTILLKDGNLL